MIDLWPSFNDDIEVFIPSRIIKKITVKLRVGGYDLVLGLGFGFLVGIITNHFLRATLHLRAGYTQDRLAWSASFGYSQDNANQ